MALQRPSNHGLAYALFRLTMGLNFTVHGLRRLLGGAESLAQFRAYLLQTLQDSGLPKLLVEAMGGVLPVAELIVGLLLTVGLFTREALAGGAVLIAILIIGAGLAGEWGLVSAQMIYAIAFYLLLRHLDQNQHAWDGLRSGTKAQPATPSGDSVDKA